MGQTLRGKESECWEEIQSGEDLNAYNTFDAGECRISVYNNNLQ